MTPSDSPLVRRLAELLGSYESDEPHESDEINGHYPDVPVGDWLLLAHEGDCTGLPATCLRCFAENVTRKARWLAERLGVEFVPSGPTDGEPTSIVKAFEALAEAAGGAFDGEDAAEYARKLRED